MDKLKLLWFFCIAFSYTGSNCHYKLKDFLNEESIKSFETGEVHDVPRSALIVISNSNIQNKK